ncbi:hypothetical protein AA984_23425 [Brevibacillus formosus]|uniref:Uncharacterized protein n=1 Tax=Brevibacillus formosus TaxID=54913 RepID=A0A837KGT3_9BACL|nr:hypothetical protein AA984_23425 [Brevibacillus formosus]PSJ96971.1 hypothetical protein C7R91_10035 [Brevibacillus formosus]
MNKVLNNTIHKIHNKTHYELSHHSGGEEKAQFSSTLTRPQGGFTGRLHLKKVTVEPKPPYGRTFLKEEVFDKRGPLF